MPIYLSFKEMWRNKGRFLLFSLVIALITVLVLFIAALSSEIAAWEQESNHTKATVKWQFKTADARTKLKRLYLS